jgi:hypothetical protein
VSAASARGGRRGGAITNPPGDPPRDPSGDAPGPPRGPAVTRLEALADELRDVTRAWGLPYSEPATPPYNIGFGAAFVIWSNRIGFLRTRWLTAHARDESDRMVLRLQEKRRSRTAYQEEISLQEPGSSERVEALRDSWMWLLGLANGPVRLPE